MSTVGKPNLLKLTLLSIGGLCLLATGLLSITGNSEVPSSYLLFQRETFLKLQFAFLLLALCFLIEAGIVGTNYDSPRTKVAIFSLPILCLLIFLIYKERYGLEEPVYLGVVREDSIVEYATFIALVLASLFSIQAARLLWRLQMKIAGILLTLLAAFTLLVALEEISYGQRILGFQTPEALEEINKQQEFNIHNISSLSDLTYVLLPSLVISYCLLGWLVLALFKATAPSLLYLLREIEMVVVPWYAASYFIPLAIYRWFEIGGYPVDSCCFAGQFLIWQDQEPAEMFFGLGFLVFALDRVITANYMMNASASTRLVVRR